MARQEFPKFTFTFTELKTPLPPGAATSTGAGVGAGAETSRALPTFSFGASTTATGAGTARSTWASGADAGTWGTGGAGAAAVPFGGWETVKRLTVEERKALAAKRRPLMEKKLLLSCPHSAGAITEGETEGETESKTTREMDYETYAPGEEFPPILHEREFKTPESVSEELSRVATLPDRVSHFLLYSAPRKKFVLVDTKNPNTKFCEIKNDPEEVCQMVGRNRIFEEIPAKSMPGKRMITPKRAGFGVACGGKNWAYNALPEQPVFFRPPRGTTVKTRGYAEQLSMLPRELAEITTTYISPCGPLTEEGKKCARPNNHAEQDSWYKTWGSWIYRTPEGEEVSCAQECLEDKDICGGWFSHIISVPEKMLVTQEGVTEARKILKIELFIKIYSFAGEKAPLIRHLWNIELEHDPSNPRVWSVSPENAAKFEIPTEQVPAYICSEINKLVDNYTNSVEVNIQFMTDLADSKYSDDYGRWRGVGTPRENALEAEIKFFDRDDHQVDYLTGIGWETMNISGTGRAHNFKIVDTTIDVPLPAYRLT